VKARGDSVRYRLGKFVRRRKWPVMAGLVTGVALLTAYGITLNQYHTAERERARANARFDQARQLARDVLYDVYDQMAGVQGTLPAREQLAETGVAFLDELAADPSAPDDLLLDIGSHYSRLYDLYAGLGVASLGQTEKAYEQLEKAEAALKQLIAKTPDNVKAVSEMVWVKRLAANHALNYGMDTDRAIAQSREGLALADATLAALQDTDWPLQSHRWNIRIDLVKSLIWAQEFDEALGLLDEYLPDLERPGWSENLPGWERKRIYAYSMRGEAHMDAGNEAAAIPDFEIALDHYARRADESPGNAQATTQLLRINHNLSHIYVKLENWGAALRHATAGRDAGRVLVAKDPRDMQSRRNVALHDQQIGKILSRQGQYDEAQASIERALDTFRQLEAEDPENRGLVRDRAIALTDAGEVLEGKGAPREACLSYERAQALWRGLDAEGEVTQYHRVNGMQVTEHRLGTSCP
ncbi:MAG: hypothetical protein AAFU65_08175, partial [Pseudomonadota bacterium]